VKSRAKRGSRSQRASYSCKPAGQLIAPYAPDQNGRSMNSVNVYPVFGEP
jgi:hypothetical protein